MFTTCYKSTTTACGGPSATCPGICEMPHDANGRQICGLWTTLNCPAGSSCIMDKESLKSLRSDDHWGVCI
jgi:hypothetical protein